MATPIAGCRGGGGRPAGPAPTSAAVEGIQATEVEVLGSPLVIPAGLEVDGLDVGGLSGLVYLGEDRYLAISDNQGRTPARVFELAFAVGPAGPAPLPGRSAREVVTGVVRLQGLDGGNFDGEGVAATPWATVLVASETEPSVREMSPDGRLEGVLPVGDRFLKDGEERGIGGNLGFESLALSPDGTVLWTGTERALEQDAPGAGAAEASPVRLVRFRRAPESFVPDGEFVYQVEAIEDPPVLGFRVRGLSELAVLPDGRLLALEREYVTGRGNRVQLYLVTLAGATDVSDIEALAGRMREVRPVGKMQFYDFALAGFPSDNLEGMTLGPQLPDGSLTIVLVSDDNFDPTQVTHLVALKLPVAAAEAADGGATGGQRPPM